MYAKEWLRLVLSPFYHGSDMHLYYNMLSLLYKGSWLEKKFGTPYFLYLMGVFTALTNAMYILLGLVLTKIFNDDGYIRACAVGFSGSVHITGCCRRGLKDKKVSCSRNLACRAGLTSRLRGAHKRLSWAPKRLTGAPKRLTGAPRRLGASAV